MTVSRRTLETAAAPAVTAHLPRIRVPTWLPFSGILLMAALIRIVHLSPSFPLNDGGLFVVMAEDIQHAHFWLPAFTSYNGGDIPFAYPPFMFYLAAGIEVVTPGSMIAVVGGLALVGSLLVIWAFWRLASVILDGKAAPLIATLLFAIVPRSFTWLIMGGGLTRSFGLFFALLAVRAAMLAMRDEQPRRQMAFASVLTGLTLLTHIETGVFLALMFLMLVVWRPRPGLRRVPAIGAAGMLIAAPWLALVVGRHGFEAFFAAMDQGGGVLTSGDTTPIGWMVAVLRDPVFTGEPYFPLIGAIGVAGAFYALARGNWFLPATWIVIMLAGLRASNTFGIIPLTLLGGMLIAEVIVPAAMRWRGAWTPQRLRVLVFTSMAGAIFFFVALQGSLARQGAETRFLDALDASDRAAMEWARQETPAGAEFVVIPTDEWYVDAASEWFPALADRESILTLQGYEWIEGAFDRRLELHQNLRTCIWSGADCIASVLAGETFDYVYIPSGCCDALQASIRASGDYEVVYGKDDTMIARWDPYGPAFAGPRLPGWP